MLAYKVKSGDTLSKISRRFNVSLDAIVQLNGIRNPDRMRVGQILQIPENNASLILRGSHTMFCLGV